MRIVISGKRCPQSSTLRAATVATCVLQRPKFVCNRNNRAMMCGFDSCSIAVVVSMRPLRDVCDAVPVDPLVRHERLVRSDSDGAVANVA